jgi:DNA helicase INO80
MAHSENGYHYDEVGGEHRIVAGDLEVVDDSGLSYSTTLSALRGPGKDVIKRPASAGSNSSSELEIPAAYRREKEHDSSKRRKVDRENDITDELERSISGEYGAPHLPRLQGSKGKGKGKQLQREESVESISTIPRAGRKRPVPRKKLDTFPPETLEGLGLGRSSTPLSADMTPNVSRPTSPAPVTSIVYDFGEIIPPLKRARKVDDGIMLKRIKGLEDAQRKVWTNIARRDVAKV